MHLSRIDGQMHRSMIDRLIPMVPTLCFSGACRTSFVSYSRVLDDSSELLRRRIRELREEIDALSTEQARLRRELPQVGQDIEARVAAQPKKGSVVLSFLLLPTIAIVGVGIFAVAGGASSDSETFYGRVVSTSGRAPVEEGARCTIFVEPGGEDYDAQFAVLCNSRLVYGGDSVGFIPECTERGDLRFRCVDGEYSADSGDPAFLFDRMSRLARVEDGPPRWRVDIELTTPPAGIGAAQ